MLFLLKFLLKFHCLPLLADFLIKNLETIFFLNSNVSLGGNYIFEDNIYLVVFMVAILYLVVVEYHLI